MTAATYTETARFVPPVLPWRAAWSGAVHRRPLWITFGAWLVMSVGFGVGMLYAMYLSFADGAMSAADLRSFSEAFLLSQFDSTAAGTIPFWGAAVALSLGTLVVGSEYTKRTVTLIHTAGPSRTAVLSAQVLVLAAILGLAVLGTLVVNAAGMAVVCSVEGWPLEAPPLGATLLSALGAWLTALAYGLAGVALAVLTRGEGRALGIGLVWFLGIETVLVKIFGALGWTAAGQITLGGATSDLAVARGAYPWWPNSLTDQVTAGQGAASAATIAIWAGAAMAVAVWAIRRRDI
jgi:ABC-type transport system involved in multi-copper enzyme maturation permease subunit